MLFFLLLLLLFRSICHQVSNKADELVLLAIFIVSEHRYSTLKKRNAALVLDWKKTTGTPYLEIFLRTQKKIALTKHAAQSGHAFNWDCAHVLHHVNSFHKSIFLESFYINLKTNTVNDKSANFPAIYYNVLKHELSLSVTGLPW